MDSSFLQGFSCCCVNGDQSDAHQISYPGDPKLDEERHPGPLLLSNSGPGHMGKISQTNLGLGHIEPLGALDGQGFSTVPNSSRSTAPSSARSNLTNEDRRKEKERLQDMVKEFAKTVVQGQKCQWLPPDGDAPVAATYSFDKALKHFSLVPNGSQPVTFEMMHIEDVTKDCRETQFANLMQVSTVGDDIERCFVCVQHQENGSGKKQLGLLMPNPHERERFYTCMKILRWAMDSRRGKP